MYDIKLYLRAKIFTGVEIKDGLKIGKDSIEKTACNKNVYEKRHCRVEKFTVRIQSLVVI